VRALNAWRIDLHVFGHNPGAQALYAALGYRVTSVTMAKSL
jgi:ribosomal protein S18 acetylase RimI-like enzyme